MASADKQCAVKVHREKKAEAEIVLLVYFREPFVDSLCLILVMTKEDEPDDKDDRNLNAGNEKPLPDCGGTADPANNESDDRIDHKADP